MGKKTLEEWRERIAEEVDYVDVKPYSHNLINLALGAIAENYGQQQADKAIDDYHLERLGWHKLKKVI
jgi:hypothetical protein